MNERTRRREAVHWWNRHTAFELTCPALNGPRGIYRVTRMRSQVTCGHCKRRILRYEVQQNLPPLARAFGFDDEEHVE